MPETTYGVIRIDLITPILFPTNRPWEGIKLDGLLGWLWAKDQGLNKTPAENDPANLRFPELPLLEISHQVYGASTMFLPTSDELGIDPSRPNLVSSSPELIIKSGNWTKPMREQIRLGMKDFKPNLSSGPYRAAMVSYWSLSTPYIYFYFATQDYDSLKGYFYRIPKECFGIGAKTRSGYGRIKDVSYSVVAQDDCFYCELDGLPTRPIPVSAPEFKGKFPDSCIGYSSFRNPYFSPETKANCYLPPVYQYLPQSLVMTTALNNALDQSCKQQQQRFAVMQEKEQKKKGSRKKK